MAEQLQLPHKLILDHRKDLTVTGVTEVVSFDDSTAVLRTEQGTLLVHGSALQLKTLSTDGGQVVVEGNVSALVYENTGNKGGWKRRLFG